MINIDYPTQTEDYVHRIGRTARNSNTGTAFTLITSENAKHVPKLIEILREANQLVSDNLLALVKNNGSSYRNGPNRFQSRINFPIKFNLNLILKFKNLIITIMITTMEIVLPKEHTREIHQILRSLLVEMKQVIMERSVLKEIDGMILLQKTASLKMDIIVTEEQQILTHLTTLIRAKPKMVIHLLIDTRCPIH